MTIVHLGDSRESISLWMRNPDFLRGLDRFCKSIFSDNQGLGCIKARDGADFFSENFYHVYEEILGNEEGLREFLAWIREELLHDEHLLLDFRKKYSSEKITDFLMLLFYIQREIELNPEKPLIQEIFQEKVREILNYINSSLSEVKADIRKSIMAAIELGYFPISSQGEILIFIQEIQVGAAHFLSFPSSKVVIASKNGAIINENGEPIYDEVEDDNHENVTQRDFLVWLFRDEDIENMDSQELETRIEIVKKWLHFHTGKGIILSKNEEFAYRMEYNAWYENRGDEEDYEEMTPESKRYYNSLFEKEIERQLSHLERIYNRKKRGIQIVK